MSGIKTGSEGNSVAFSGSMNESSTAMSINYETIDVFRSWGDTFEANQERLKENAFVSIWNNTEPNIQVLEFPSISQAMIEKYRKKPVDYDVDQKQFTAPSHQGKKKGNIPTSIGARIPPDVTLHDYQKEAIASWVGENYRGIFDMATGTGKTYTGLGAVSKLCEDLKDDLAVVIVCPYQHLVEQWVEDIVRFNIKPIIGYSSSSQKDWKKRLAQAVRDQKLRADKKFFCFICTNATFTNPYVQEQIGKIKSPVLLLVDEAHNFGAKSLSQLLDDRFEYRLALSATLERHRDEEGTAALYNFFGKKCIVYSLERAIKEDKLTPYKYHPVLVYLNEEELGHYEQISYELSKHVIKGKNGRIKLDSYGEILAIKRSRIVAGAINKIDRLLDVITPYKDDHFLLVYCGATHIASPTSDRTDTDESEIKQIEAVTRLLGNSLGMKVSKFTAEEDIEERNSCLDEGVNIPGIKTAFILASTTNPKEYIQRRGRVLRKSPGTGKEYAEIYDFVTLPRPLDEVSGLTEDQMKRDLSLVKSSGKIKTLTTEIEKLQAELDSIEKRLGEIEDEIDAAETSKAKFEADIKQYADGEKLQNEKDRLTRELAAAKKTKAQFIKGLCRDLNDDMTTFFAMSMVQKALELVSKSDFGGKDIPEMHSKTIQYLLKRGTCLCGTQLMEGSIPYKNLVNLIDYLPPQSIGVTVGSFIKESRAHYRDDNDLFGTISDTLATIGEQDDTIADLSEQVSLVSSKLEGDDVREQVKKINAQIIACANIIASRKAEQKKLLNRQGAAETEKKQKENSRSELSLMDKNNQHIERCKAYALRIFEELQSEYQHREKEIRDKLEASINNIFKTIYDGGLSLSIDEKYNISVYVSDFEGGVETSTAQSISVIFAFISAIIKMARDNRIENGDESYSEPYPLVMDAPLSAFDKRRIQAICTAIPETAEQVIIFIKDTDGDLAEEHLGTKVKTRHHFIKLDEFNTRLD